MADLIVTQDVADSLGTAYSGRADIARLISAASALVELHCGRTFAQAALDERYDGTGTETLLVDRPPIVSVTAISEDGTALDNSQGLEWNAEVGGRAIHRGQGREDPRDAEVWEKGRRNIRVQYTGGYSAVPDAVKQATVLLVRHLADSASFSPLLRREQIGDYSYELSALAVERDQLPAVVMALLEPYRLRTIR